MRIISLIAFILVIIGGLAWGVIGVSGFNVIGYVFGPIKLEKIAYIVIGIAAIWVAIAGRSLRRKG